MECPKILSGIFNVREEYLNATVNRTNFTLEDHEYNMRKLKFIAYGIIGSIIICMGVLGNIINLAVLTRPNLKGVTFVYLTWLAISDLMTLVLGITSMLRLQGIQSTTYSASLYYAYAELPLVNAFMASSVFLVVALTVDRYFSVCLPTKFKDIHNKRRAKRSIAMAYVISFLIYIPICFQKIPVEFVNSENETVYVACENPSVFKHPAFKIYLLVKELTVRLGPVVILAILNVTIIVTFGKILRRRKEMFGNASLRREGSRKYTEEKRLIVLLCGIVVLFFVCMTPAALLTLLNSDDKEANFSFQVFRSLANVIELANFSMNFYVYCFCSSDIRRTFVGLILRRNKTTDNNFRTRKGSLLKSTKL
ncbi:probable G-protein coupled receptor B0563.6 [Centruroides vittatus]|uniref:probable G-protein coupled receptor B0563.6 n=1 Tax=Centruroides vittatus TaxID=120091 RepID=UPI00350F0EBA